MENPQKYRDLACKFYIAALREPQRSSAAKFNNEQGDAWLAYAERLASSRVISPGYYFEKPLP